MRKGLTLIELVVTLAILALVAGLLIAAAQKIRTAAAKGNCLNVLRQLSISVQSHVASKDVYPPGVGYQTAFGICVAFQLTVLFWFAMPWLRAMLGDLVHSRHEFRRKDRQRDTAVQYESVVDTDLSAGVEW